MHSSDRKYQLDGTAYHPVQHHNEDRGYQHYPLQLHGHGPIPRAKGRLATAKD